MLVPRIKSIYIGKEQMKEHLDKNAELKLIETYSRPLENLQAW